VVKGAPIEGLIAFVDIAESGSINSAATALNISQPSLTRTIQQLEHAVGGRLFDRSSKGVKLTSLGQTLLNHARAVRGEARKAQQTIDLLRKQRLTELHVGLVPAQHPLQLLTRAIVDFSAANPKINIYSRMGTVEELLELLSDGKIEVIVGPLAGDRHTRSVAIEYLYDDVPEMCCRASHPLANKAVAFKELETAEWVLGPPGSPSRLLISKLFSENRASAEPNVKIEVDNVFVRLSLVRQSNLLSVFDLHHVNNEIHDETLTRLRFKWSQQRRPMGVMKTVNPSPIARAFVQTLRRCYARNGLAML
jgi:DNA-binding transcriptional LysR family regulator